MNGRQAERARARIDLLADIFAGMEAIDRDETRQELSFVISWVVTKGNIAHEESDLAREIGRQRARMETDD